MRRGPDSQLPRSWKPNHRRLLIGAGCVSCCFAIISGIQNGADSTLDQHLAHIRPVHDTPILLSQDQEDFSLGEQQSSIHEVTPPEAPGLVTQPSYYLATRDISDDIDRQPDEQQASEILDIGYFMHADDGQNGLPPGAYWRDIGDFVDADRELTAYRIDEIRDIGGFIDADDEHDNLSIPQSGQVWRGNDDVIDADMTLSVAMLPRLQRMEIGNYLNADDAYNENFDSYIDAYPRDLGNAEALSR